MFVQYVTYINVIETHVSLLTAVNCVVHFVKTDVVEDQGQEQQCRVQPVQGSGTI